MRSSVIEAAYLNILRTKMKLVINRRSLQIIDTSFEERLNKDKIITLNLIQILSMTAVNGGIV